MLTIKLSKVGKKNKKMFRIVISEKARDPYGRALEILGSYNPYSKDLKIKTDRVKYWLSKGSGMTPSINNLLIENKIIEGKKEKNSKVGTPNKRKIEKNEKKKIKEEKENVKEEAVAPTEVENNTGTEENLIKTEEKPVETPVVESPAEENKTEEATPEPEKETEKAE